MPKAGIAFERQLHLGVGAQGRAATLDNAIAHKEAFTLSERDACDVISRTSRWWGVYFEQCGVGDKNIGAVATAFRRIEDVAGPDLRRRLA